MDYEDRMTIPTAEGVVIEVTLAGLGSRLAAAIVDALIQFVLVMAIAVIVLINTDISPSAVPDESPQGSDAWLGLAVGQLLTFAILFFYYAFFEGLWSGRSPGKRALGLRVVQIGGQPVGFRISAVRNLLRLVDLLPTAYLIGIITMLASSRNQRLGDMVAGTVVIRERSPAALPTGSLDRGEVADIPSWDVSGVTAYELAAIRKFLQRREALPTDKRDEIAREIAARVQPKVAGAPPDMGSEEFLEKLTAVKGARA